MNTMKLRLEGAKGVPMLQNNIRTADPTDEIVREMKKVSGIRKKTPEHDQELDRLKFFGSIYFDDEIGVYVPATWVEGSIREGAKAEKRGKDVTSCVFVEPDMIPLDFAWKNGQKSVDVFYNDSRFVDRRAVVIGRSKVMAVRAKFTDWSLDCTIHFDPKIIDEDALRRAVENAGRTKGIGDYRPRFGRYMATLG